MAKQPKKQEVGTTGHSWDGIEELNNPLPRWWLWTFYACILFAIVYTILYPAWPLVKGETPGLLHYSTRAAVAKDIAKFDKQNAAIEAKLAKADLTKISEDADLKSFALKEGRAVFMNNCSQCHGAGGAGAKGYPNLLDNDWLWGGDIESIQYTITHGVRNETDEDARLSEMPKFGEMLEPEEIKQVVNYVLKISGQEHDAQLAEAGQTVFEDNCSACHGEDGTGGREVGAPNLTDVIWLYGGDEKTITETVTNSRYGVMPAWGQRLSQAEVNAVAVYVHNLGGGE